MPNPKANAPAAPNSLQRVVSFNMMYSFLFVGSSRAANRTPLRTLQRAIRVLGEWCKKAAIYSGFFSIGLTKSFAMFQREAECQLNNENGAGMNCGNIVEAASRASLSPRLRPFAARAVIF
jgi:hypothetical protein